MDQRTHDEFMRAIETGFHQPVKQEEPSTWWMWVIALVLCFVPIIQFVVIPLLIIFVITKVITGLNSGLIALTAPVERASPDLPAASRELIETVRAKKRDIEVAGRAERRYNTFMKWLFGFMALCAVTGIIGHLFF